MEWEFRRKQYNHIAKLKLLWSGQVRFTAQPLAQRRKEKKKEKKEEEAELRCDHVPKTVQKRSGQVTTITALSEN